MVADNPEHSNVVPVDPNDDDTQRMRTTVHGFIGKLTDGDLFACAAANGIFDATGEWSADHFIVTVKTAFLHQCIAVEPEFWRAKFRPKLERDFVNKVVTPDMELNFIGLPTDLIIPEAVQRKAKHRKEEPPRHKVELKHGTYVVSAEGVRMVIDRLHLPVETQKDDAPLLVPILSATIDTLFPTFKFSFTPDPAIAAKISVKEESKVEEKEEEEKKVVEMIEEKKEEEKVEEEKKVEEQKVDEEKKEEEQKVVDKVEEKKEEEKVEEKEEKKEEEKETKEEEVMEEETKEEDEAMPDLEFNAIETNGENGEKSEEEEEESDEDETMEISGMEDDTKVDGDMPALDAEETPMDTLASLLSAHANNEDVSNGVNGDAKKTRKSRSKSSKRTPWEDRVEEPKHTKRISIPSKRRADSGDQEEEKGAKRSKDKSKGRSQERIEEEGSVERSTERSVTRSKERSTSAAPSGASTPPPLLERMTPIEDEPAAAHAQNDRKRPYNRASTSLESRRAVPLPTPTTPLKMAGGHPLISIKTPPTATRPANFTRQRMRSDEERERELQQIMAAEKTQRQAMASRESSLISGLGTTKFRAVIGFKPAPKEINGLLSTPRATIPRTTARTPTIPPKKAKQEEGVKKEEAEDHEEEEQIDYGEIDTSQMEWGREEEEALGPRIVMHHGAHCNTRCGGLCRQPNEIVNVVDGENDPALIERNAEIMVEVNKMEETRIAQQERLKEKLKREGMKKAFGIGHKMARSVEAPLETRQEEGSGCVPLFSNRDDEFYLVMVRGDNEKNGQFLTRSLKPIHKQCREFYQSLMRPEPCKQWNKRPRVGPDVDGYVHHCSGATVKVANGQEMTKFHLDDLHNHKEFRLGELVWAKFQKEYWPGYIKAFLPACLFDDFKGDAIMVHWISEDGSNVFSHVCYADVFRFDFYFPIMYNPCKNDKVYQNNIARAIAMDGRPGYWEEYINKTVFDNIVSIGGNVHSMPAEHLEKLSSNTKMKGVNPSEFKKLMENIHQKEVNHFQHHYKAIYADRNHLKWNPNQDLCNELLSFTRPIEEPVRGEKRRGRPSAKGRKKKENGEDREQTEDLEEGLQNPQYSPYPLFATHITRVNICNASGEILSTHNLFKNCARSPLSDSLEEDRPAGLADGHMEVVFGQAEKERMALHLKKAKQRNESQNSDIIKQEEEEPKSVTQEDPSLAVARANCSNITAHEVLHLTDEIQTIYDKYEVVNDDEWHKNSIEAARHKEIELEIKNRKIKEYNQKIEEKRRQDGEKKELARQKQEEKAALRQARNGPLVVPTKEKWHEKRRSKVESEPSQITHATHQPTPQPTPQPATQTPNPRGRPPGSGKPKKK